MRGENILKSVSSKSSSEFYTPIPKGYKRGRTKYVVVAGSVISGSGKGIFSSSLAKLLKYYGLNVSPIKIDGYFNQDAGTLSPFRHGEVFVLDDGLECDMDLGSYERFMDQTLTKNNYLTSGMVFNNVLTRERKGGYLGRDVQFIPHVMGEIKLSLRNLAMKSNADVVIVEIGGTIGDYENAYIIEAIRQLKFEEGEENVCFVNISYIIEPNTLGEQKSKPAQLGLNRLMGLGIQPDLIVCRSESPIKESIREKISVYSNLPVKNVIGLHDTSTVYKAPLLLKQMRTDDKVLDILGLKDKKNLKLQRKELIKWSNFVKRYNSLKKEIIIGIAGKYTGLNDSYASILKALEHAGTFNGTKIKIKYIETTAIESGKLNIEDTMEGVQGLVVPGGFGKRGSEGKINCVRYVRENDIPFLGLCFGFQMAVIEFARNVCNINDANSTELNNDCLNPVISILPEQKKIEGLGGNMRLGGHNVLIKKETQAFNLYKNTKTRLRFRHRFEVDPNYIKVLEEHGLVFSGKAPKFPIMQVLELPQLKYFMATQAHPEFNSRPLRPEPLFNGFVKSIIQP